MSAPWGEERPPVSRLLYRLPPFLSPPPPPPPPALPPQFSLVTSLIFCLCLPPSLSPTHSVSPLFSFLNNSFIWTHTHTHARTHAHTHTQRHTCSPKHTEAMPSQTFLFKARSKKLKFYSNECLLFLLPRCVCVCLCVYMCVCVCVCICGCVCVCVLRCRGKIAPSMQVCVRVSVCYMHGRRRRADSRW